jgi:hypothetical protein
MANQPVPFAGDLPHPYGGGYRHGTFRGWSWARETTSGRYTLRDPAGRIVAGCTSWWRAAHVAQELDRSARWLAGGAP